MTGGISEEGKAVYRFNINETWTKIESMTLPFECYRHDSTFVEIDDFECEYELGIIPKPDESLLLLLFLSAIQVSPGKRKPCLFANRAMFY